MTSVITSLVSRPAARRRDARRLAEHSCFDTIAVDHSLTVDGS